MFALLRYRIQSSQLIGFVAWLLDYTKFEIKLNENLNVIVARHDENMTGSFLRRNLLLRRKVAREEQ